MLEQSSLDQLEKWLMGVPTHNEERNECCPDFSCCNPDLLADRETRRLFYAAVKNDNWKLVEEMIGGFLGILAESAIEK